MGYYLKRKNKLTANQSSPIIPTKPATEQIVGSFLVIEGNKRIMVETKGILFFSANPPYINIYCNGNKYLYNETLKSVLTKVDGELFVRIHKSVIINITQVQMYKSRLNGDYDITMRNGTELRLSRNYAKEFKLKFNQTHQHTA